MTPEKEKELLTALSKGNQSAFDSLYLFYAPKVREFVFRLLKNPGEAEDVTQNIFLRVWEKRRELGGTRSLRSYLYTMARNAVSLLASLEAASFPFPVGMAITTSKIPTRSRIKS